LWFNKDGMKGRRVLQFGSTNATLLKGKSIYLDLHGYKRAGYIESGLKERGAVSLTALTAFVLFQYNHEPQ